MFYPTAVLSSHLGPLQSGSGTCIVRWASKKAGSSSRNRGGKAPGQRLGKKVKEGEYVRANQILVRQKFSFRWLPGQFVLAGYRRTLNAQVDGQVYFTKQKWQPAPEDDWSKNVAPMLPDERLEKKFVNVKPAPQIGKFRLVTQI
ncbi:putative 39S ribosomal protein L27, mitochondrial [Apostichopus japonicus]|uniref:Large ribosomal subunit protein bL27m n=2 Tax=Stichopus japonicus TaxID=307972 RepID=A0A2G8KXL5_STIJA|nr:putative 39S ribosomal protein L27, mitochondrial [Apostichopus japonicus]